MQGHLEKVHAKSHAFTPSSAKRYFFLTPQPSATLLYFRSEADCRVGKVRSLTRPAAHTRLTHTAAASRRRSHTHAVCSHKVRGFVNIGADCRVETDVSGSRSFVVHTPERQLRLIAESPSEAQRWVTVRAASIHTPLRPSVLTSCPTAQAISAVARGSGPPAPPLQRQRPGRRGTWRQMREAAAEEVVRRAATARTAELPPPPPSPRPRHPVRAALRLLERIRRAGFRSLAGLIAALRAALCVHAPRAEPLAGETSATARSARDAAADLPPRLR